MSLFADELPPGLLYFPNWLTESEEVALLREIDSRDFDNTLSRRVQHYGARYDYRAGVTKGIGSAPPIPPELLAVAERLVSEGIFRTSVDQVIINEYVGDQGIAPHIDSQGFGDAVATVSLLETWPMEFVSPDGCSLKVLLDRRSLAVMTGPARYEWTHSIPKRKTTEQGGIRIARGRRLSVTLRTLN